MAQNIGSLGTERAAIDMEFNYFGETIRVHPDASNLTVLDMMMDIGDLDADTDDPEVIGRIMSGLAKQLLGQIHPEDKDRFWELAKANRQQMQDILQVSKNITEAVAGFPTGQSSVSLPTPNRDSPNSERKSLSRAERRALARRIRAGQATDSALTLLQGRPDLQAAVLNAKAARESEAG